MIEKEIIDILALGNVQEAISQAEKAGLLDLSSCIKKSITHTKDLRDYFNYYKQDWDGIEKRTPGAQLQQGWILDARQTEARNQIRELHALSLLDVGCADGTFVFNLLQDHTVEFALGVDPWVNGIRYAKQLAVQYNGRAQFKHGVFEDIELDKIYDAIHFGEILEHVIDPVTILNQAKNSLSTNGGIVVTVPIKRPPLSTEESKLLTSGEPNQHIRHIDRDTLSHYAQETGLKIITGTVDGSSWQTFIATLIRA